MSLEFGGGGGIVIGFEGSGVVYDIVVFIFYWFSGDMIGIFIWIVFVGVDGLDCVFVDIDFFYFLVVGVVI